MAHPQANLGKLGKEAFVMLEEYLDSRRRPTTSHWQEPYPIKKARPQANLGKVRTEGFGMLEEYLDSRRRPTTSHWQEPYPIKKAVMLECMQDAREHGGVVFVKYFPHFKFHGANDLIGFYAPN